MRLQGICVVPSLPQVPIFQTGHMRPGNRPDGLSEIGNVGFRCLEQVAPGTILVSGTVAPGSGRPAADVLLQEVHPIKNRLNQREKLPSVTRIELGQRCIPRILANALKLLDDSQLGRLVIDNFREFGGVQQLTSLNQRGGLIRKSFRRLTPKLLEEELEILYRQIEFRVLGRPIQDPAQSLLFCSKLLRYVSQCPRVRPCHALVPIGILLSKCHQLGLQDSLPLS